MSVLEWCPYQRCAHIREVSVSERCPYQRGVCIREVSILVRCPYYRGVSKQGVCKIDVHKRDAHTSY